MVKQSKTSKQKNNPYKNLKTGAFTKQAKAQGMSVDKFATYVIKNYKDKKSKYFIRRKIIIFRKIRSKYSKRTN